MNKSFLLLIAILLVPFINADSLSTGANNLQIVTNIPDSVSQNITRDWQIQVFNSTSVLTSGLTCYFDIYNEQVNGSLIHQNISTSFSGTFMRMNVPAMEFADKGTYSFRAYCNTTTQAGLYLKNFYVTKGGDNPAGESFKIFIYLMFIIVSAGLFYSLFMNIVKLATLSTNIYDVLISWGFVILSLILIFLSENYLLLLLVENSAYLFFTITAWACVFLPILGFTISFIVGMLTKKTSDNSQQMMGGRR